MTNTDSINIANVKNSVTGNLRTLAGLMSGALLLTVTSCHSVPEWPQDPVGNFDALWTTVDEHYCFFEEKGIDWDSVYRVYRPKVSSTTETFELFEICSDMLNELRDGHVNLSSSFKTSYYRNWWSDYPQNFNKRLIQENYFNFEYSQVGGFTYGFLADSTVGYIGYQSFASPAGTGTIDLILYQMSRCKGLIIDIRDNGGGDLTNVETLVSHFIDHEVTAGYISHKTGPAHDSFSKPYRYTYQPDKARVIWLRPVMVLTNRSTFSAANNFAAVMKSLSLVKLVGATTGGGSGMPFSSEIPCGWGLRMSGSRLYDPAGNSTEQGVTPSEGFECEMLKSDMDRGIDTILERALEGIEEYYTDNPDVDINVSNPKQTNEGSV